MAAHTCWLVKVEVDEDRKKFQTGEVYLGCRHVRGANGR
jgi:hypothetical protein